DVHALQREAAVLVVEVAVGDRVLVHAGCIIQVMQPKEADEIEELFRIVEDL
ncbi:MAG: HypC/HybG/HupF family hydrogenase formation chaperone, partial [Butyrivibrio sp.]|nr:HypC/HybG/HupF family hydrogenase formation chaperone [Butyrivibrio sp.]